MKKVVDFIRLMVAVSVGVYLLWWLWKNLPAYLN